MTKKLEVSDLVFDYENRKILNHLDFSVNEGGVCQYPGTFRLR